MHLCRNAQFLNICTIDNNKDYPNDIARRYFSQKITYRELFEKIDECVRALVALGVTPGEIMTVALPGIPKALYIVYALNNLGAVANMFFPKSFPTLSPNTS